MSNSSTNTIELHNSLQQAAELVLNSKPSLIEKIDSSVPLAVIVGVSVSAAAFVLMFALGMYCERTLFEAMQLETCPVELLAASVTAVNTVIMILTLKAGLGGDLVKALSYGSMGALILGFLGAAAGISI